jgi:single-strand DNA-binding protein
VNDVFVTATGNLVTNPHLNRTEAGTPVANLRIACTPRRATDGQWTDAAEPIYLNVVAWGDLAKNVAASLIRGTRVVVTGRLRQHTYDAGNGHHCATYEILATEIAPSLRRATVPVVRRQSTASASDDPTLPFDDAPDDAAPMPKSA